MSETKLTLLRAHFERIARRLQVEGDAARSFHHSLHKGQIREAFIREFLEDNTSTLCGIGTGEIIHESTMPGDPRNQIDVVVYNKGYPKLSMATNIDIFFAETVSSFIEIKSSLTKEHISKTAVITKKIKIATNLAPQELNPTGMVRTPRPYSFIFAYDGPKQIETLLRWMKEVSEEDDYNLDALRTAAPQQRGYFDNQFIDGVFILGKGFVLVDALPMQSPLMSIIEDGDDITLDSIWCFGKKDELIHLWALINRLSENQLWNNFDMTKYIGLMEWFVSN